MAAAITIIKCLLILNKMDSLFFPLSSFANAKTSSLTQTTQFCFKLVFAKQIDKFEGKKKNLPVSLSVSCEEKEKQKNGENPSVGVERRDIALSSEKPIEAAGAKKKKKKKQQQLAEVSR